MKTIVTKFCEFLNEFRALKAHQGNITQLRNQKLAPTVSLIIPARNSDEVLERTVTQAHGFLAQRFPGKFEIILVPNQAGNENEKEFIARELADSISAELSNRYPEVRVCPHFAPRGKGAAIRTGFFQSRGKWIFLTDADLPYDLRFFEEACEYLESGYDLVTGNRRLTDSYFQIPVHILPLAYKRHRLGLLYNRLVRFLFPILTTDTQAGIKAMTRHLALEAFSRQACPGFLYDLEIFLTAIRQGFRQVSLPVTLDLRSEKSTVRVIRESLLVAAWLLRIRWNDLKKHYGEVKTRSLGHQILTRYKKTNWGTRLFLHLRWYLTPYPQMLSYLPWKGKILDLGCGHGLLSAASALGSPAREVMGWDHDAKRVQLASQMLNDLPNLKVQSGSLLSPLPEPLQIPQKSIVAATLIDVLHYFTPEMQEALVKQIYALLEEGGILLIREVDRNSGLASTWNQFYETLATRIGFTKDNSKNEEHHFRSRYDWETFIRNQGFRVRSERCSSILFDDILYICERPIYANANT